MSSTEYPASLTEEPELSGNKDDDDYGIFGITREFTDNYDIVIHVYVNTAVCILGLFGNTLGIMVLLKDIQCSRASIYRYMLALMVFDNVYLFLGLASSAVAIIKAYDFYLHNFINNHFPFVSGFLDMMAFHVSSIILIIMALERLNALVRPLQVKHSCFSKCPVKIILLVFVGVVVYLLPFPFCFEVLDSKDQENKTLYFLQTKPDFFDFYTNYNLVETVITCLYPVALLVINIAIPIFYCRAVQKRKTDLRSSSYDNQQLKITFVVLWLAFLYTVFATPKVFSQCLIYIDYNYQFDGKYAPTFFFLLFTGNLFQTLNAANDFFVYILISKRDRNILRFIICEKCISAEERKTFRNRLFGSSYRSNS